MQLIKQFTNNAILSKQGFNYFSSMIQVKEYGLPDLLLLHEEHEPETFRTWIPDKSYIVLGQSNKAENSIHIEAVQQDQIGIIKRPSGGEAVIITPKTLIISAFLISQKMENPSKYFLLFNKRIIRALESLNVENLKYRGISDIAIGEKKILGSSIYRKTKKVLYHAVLNICEESSLMERYLKHPAKEPDYRKGRKHSDFVSSLHEASFLVSHQDVIQALANES
jgi:lipoate---protein ligase